MITKPIAFKAPPADAECTHWDFEFLPNSTALSSVRCRLCGKIGVPQHEAYKALVEKMKSTYHPWLDVVGAPKSRVIEVKTAGGAIFRARQLPAGYLPKPAMKKGGWFWVATDPAYGEPPTCWDNNVCWDCNEAGRPSDPVVAWRELVL